MRLQTRHKRLIVILALSWWLLSYLHRHCDRPDRPDHVEAYIREFGPLAVELYDKTGIPPAIPLAVGGLESAWGSSELALKGRNHFGIKARNGQRRCCLPTTEYYNGRRHREVACFRAYDDPAEGYYDFARFLLSQPRYDALFRIPTSDYQAWAEGLEEYGYATDPRYAEKLTRVMKRYRLYRIGE